MKDLSKQLTADIRELLFFDENPAESFKEVFARLDEKYKKNRKNSEYQNIVRTCIRVNFYAIFVEFTEKAKLEKEQMVVRKNEMIDALVRDHWDDEMRFTQKKFFYELRKWFAEYDWKVNEIYTRNYLYDKFPEFCEKHFVTLQILGKISRKNRENEEDLATNPNRVSPKQAIDIRKFVRENPDSTDGELYEFLTDKYGTDYVPDYTEVSATKNDMLYPLPRDFQWW
jgi:hypothetical protein